MLSGSAESLVGQSKILNTMSQVNISAELEAFHNSLTTDQKVEILKTAFTQLQSNRKESEALENKMAFSSITLLMLLTAYVLKGEYVAYGAVRIGMITFCILATALSIWFLYLISKRIRVQMSMIVRIEQVMGLFTEKLFMNESDLELFNNLPYAETSIYPKETQRWGAKGWLLLFTPHTLGVLLAGVIACLVLSLSLQPTKAVEKQETTIQLDLKSKKSHEVRK